MPQAEQVSFERYEHGTRLKAYIVEVRKTTKGPQIVVSRTHPGLIKRLFEARRSPRSPPEWSRSRRPRASLGPPDQDRRLVQRPQRRPGRRLRRGAGLPRVRMVTNELRGERVDVVPFSDDPIELIQNALAPARVREVRLDEETGTATVVVSDYQLSLAIGKEGQNARLAARLTGWRIDIKSESQLEEEESGYAGQEWAEGEWIQSESGEMVWKPAEGGEAISVAEWTHAAEEQAGAPAGATVLAPGGPDGPDGAVPPSRREAGNHPKPADVRKPAANPPRPKP